MSSETKICALRCHLVGKPSNSCNRFVFIIEQKRHRPHITLIRNESAGLHHLNRLCHTAGDTRPKKSHQGHGWGILGPSPSDCMPSHPLLTDFDALYLDDFFSQKSVCGDSGAFMTQFNSQKTLIFLMTNWHTRTSSRNPHTNLCLRSLAFLGLNSTM